MGQSLFGGPFGLRQEGLIFLTNDGEFALRLTHPRYEVRKKYVATVEGRVEAGDAGAVHARCVFTRAKS